jgi:hypothetical protein
MGMEVSWIPSYDIDLHDSIVKSDTCNINDYKGASLLWGKDAKPPLVIVCPALLLPFSALHPQQGQTWRFGEHIIAIWTSILNQMALTIWSKVHYEGPLMMIVDVQLRAWEASLKNPPTSSPSLELPVADITPPCQELVLLPPRAASIQENVGLLQTIDSVYKNCDHNFILQLRCSLVF